ncbi:hypothetical protein QCA50_010391 [Cerrena zonata]|uniref:F-box domain-containing protein n=1 Tax=Cerrena zonata TaxID=2478898 RepID=A0AAW0FZJ1_9APHY
MHHCLTIDKILERITGFVAAYSPDDSNRHRMEELRINISDKKSLLSFILTCRTFAELGLDVLWRRLDTIFPLAFAFLPNVSPRLKATDRSTKVIGFVRIPGPEDWIQFSRYARRLETLVHSHNAPCNVDTRFLAQFSLHRRTINLFPNLSVLSWRDNRQDHFPYISLFMGPSLTKVDIVIFSEDMYITFWDVLRHSAPAIHEIYIHVVELELSNLALDSLTNALQSLKQLMGLCSFAPFADGGLELSLGHLDHLSSIPTLRLLQYQFQVKPNLDLVREVATTSEEGFPSLEALEVHIHSDDAMDLLCIYVKRLRLPKLTNFSVFFHQQPLAVQLLRLCEALANKCQLKRIIINSQCVNWNTSIPYIITDSTVESLFTLPLTSSFGLINLPHKVTAHSLSKMATSWPNLTMLAIGFNFSPSTVLYDPIQVQDLGVFAGNLPQLSSLFITLDMKVTDNLKSQLSVRADCHSAFNALKLNIMHTVLPDTLAQTQIAAYLTSLFPNVQVEGRDPKIEEFKTLIELFKQVRGVAN